MIHAVSVGHMTWHNAVGTISCNSTFTLAVTAHGSGVTARGPISSLTFTNCTNGTVHQPITQPGTLEFHATGITGNGTLTSSGMKWGITMFGIECGYTTNATDIGDVVAGEHAVLRLKASLPRTFGSVFCGSSGNWTGEYKFTHPTGLSFH